jgi:hypothetical protein
MINACVGFSHGRKSTHSVEVGLESLRTVIDPVEIDALHEGLSASPVNLEYNLRYSGDVEYSYPIMKRESQYAYSPGQNSALQERTPSDE